LTALLTVRAMRDNSFKGDFLSGCIRRDILSGHLQKWSHPSPPKFVW
jgi:hypothetical protein